jgi:hypothetical protein
VAVPNDQPYEIEFQWKERVVYWEASRGVVFQGGWGVEPFSTLVPDAATWDRCVPDWLIGRHAEVVARLRNDHRHVVHEQRNDSSQVEPLEVVTRTNA